MIKVYCIGNPYVEGDTLALKLADVIQVDGFELVKCYKPEHIDFDDEVVVLDVVKGIQDVKVIEDLSTLAKHRMLSAHDFDFGAYLRLLMKLGMIERVTLIGVPANMKPSEAKQRVERLLKKLKSQL
ncbi:hypothetical protein DRJ48_00750 [Candidatus Woesearchaeota archaeon]|nr:MAG: hypothetical protein DRJ48_00750 [Candidatus Woesearchaeota archaeon]